MLSNHDVSFWIAVIGAGLVKLATSPRVSWLRCLISLAVAVFAAWAFTKPSLKLLGLDEDYTIPVAVLIGLTGESVIKWLIFLTSHPREALEYLRIWRLR